MTKAQTAAKAEHTKGPMKTGHLGDKLLWIGPSHDLPPVAFVEWDTADARESARENAARLALCWNAHDELVALVKRLLVEVQWRGCSEAVVASMVKDAVALLARLEK